MTGLSNSQLTIVKTLVGTVPDAALRSLDMALSNHVADDAMGVVRDMVWAESENRKIRALVLSPLLALFPRNVPELPQTRFPSDLPGILWRAMGDRSPLLIELAVTLAAKWSSGNFDPGPLDAICLDAATALREGDPIMVPVLACLRRNGQDRVDEFVRYLDLCPVLRKVLVRLPDWVSRMSEDRAAEARIAFRDACAIAEDAAPQFFEVIFTNLSEPWLVLQIISVVLDRPSDSYVAGSEIAMFGERLLDLTDRSLDDIRSMDINAGAESGLAGAAAAQTCTRVITAFEFGLTLTKDVGWGHRIGTQKGRLAQICEARMAEAEKMLGKALPMETARLGGKMSRPTPRLSFDPDPGQAQQLEALLAFLVAVRPIASLGGFASLRSKTIAAIQLYLTTYAEDLLDKLTTAEDEADRVMAFLELTALCMGYVFDDKAAAQLRHRAATANMRQMTHASGVA